MTTLRREARQQLEQFLLALFLSDELIEIRFIESWVSRRKKKSRVVRPSRWLRRHDFVSQHGEITDLARQERANIYFGVCPRPKTGDAHDDCIKSVRCIWCDIDHVTAEEAAERWRDAGVPPPSILVRSGSGVHGYWLLNRDLQTPEERAHLASLLPHFYRSFGGDHVQNLSRVLRPPGTMNFKNVRCGRTPVPCTLLTCDSTLRYPLRAFSAWIDLAESESRAGTSRRSCGTPVAFSLDEILSRRAEAVTLVSQLNKASRDRSRRDFAIICNLLRLGLAREEIWELVSGTSKFDSNGRTYFDVTFSNAERRVLLDGIAPSDPRVPT
jgi:hypothetical protein